MQGMRSPKSYVTAVCMAGIFGTLGLHHFYLGRWMHGAFDLSLALISFLLLFLCWPLAPVIFFVDIVHTVYFMYKLIVGEYIDGLGRVVLIDDGKCDKA